MPTLARGASKLFGTRYFRLGFVLVYLLATCLPAATPSTLAAPLATHDNAEPNQTRQPNQPYFLLRQRPISLPPAQPRLAGHRRKRYPPISNLS